MTGTLKDLMTERADAESPPHVDLDAIVRAGDSRVRRRRVAAGAGAAAVAAAVALGVPAVVDNSSPRPTGVVQPASGKYVDAQVTYAVGSTFHYGDQLIDVSPHKVATFVQTDDGFVFTDDSGAIFFSDGDQSVQIGETGQPYGRLLTADDSGSYVGWVDTSAAPAAEFVVYNTSSRGEVVRTSAGNQPTSDQTGEFDLPMMVAIDGQFAYWHSSAGMTAWNLSNGTADLLAPGATYKWLQDAASGQLAKMSKNGQQIVVSRDPAAADPAFPGWSAWLSPSATYLYTDAADEAKVFDVQSGEQQTPNHDGYPFIAFSQWLDDDRFVAIGIKTGNGETDPLDLLTCSVSSQKCAVAVSEAGRVSDLALPFGEKLGD